MAMFHPQTFVRSQAAAQHIKITSNYLFAAIVR